MWRARDAESFETAFDGIDERGRPADEAVPRRDSRNAGAQGGNAQKVGVVVSDLRARNDVDDDRRDFARAAASSWTKIASVSPTTRYNSMISSLRDAGIASTMARRGVMPMPAAISSTRRCVRRAAVNVPYGPSAKSRVPDRTCCIFAVSSPRFFTVKRRVVGGRHCGERERMRLVPAVHREKTPQEELPGLGTEAIETTARDVNRDDTRCLTNDRLDAHRCTRLSQTGRSTRQLKIAAATAR